MDLQAEASSVFVFRRNPQQDTTKKELPKAYRLDFSKADVFLIAGQFDLLPSDIVYVATAVVALYDEFVEEEEGCDLPLVFCCLWCLECTLLLLLFCSSGDKITMYGGGILGS